MKTVVVTGGATGIGESIVRLFAKNDYNVILNYNKSEKEAIYIKKELGDNVEIFKADISNRKEVNNLINFSIEKFGKIDVLVNNAGIELIKLFTETTIEDWHNVMDVNLTGTFNVTQEAIKDMINKKEGCIINISSIWGMVGGSCEVAYSASKAGIIGLTKALAKEVGKSNVRVNVIAPGAIDTNMLKSITEEEKKELIGEIPLSKIGMPIDIAKCVLWLAEDNYTTGQVISPNGGWIV
jgi:Dehydrogenases with different specificities (related to short-chain alcohol dehydrogenases)